MLGSVWLALPASADMAPPRPVPTEIKVGSYYFPGHFHAGRWSPMATYGHPVPLLGYYRDGAPGVMDWHIKWAVEHGLSYFVFDWYYDYRTGHVSEHNAALDEGFLQAKYRNLMQFAVFWCNEGETNQPPYTEDQLLTLARTLGQRYVRQPNYLRLGGQPALFISEPMRLWQSFGPGFRDLLPRLSRAAGLPEGTDLFLVGKQSDELDKLAQMGFSACTAYNYAGTRFTDTASPLRATYDEMIGAYESMWQKVTAAHALPYLVPVSPGWDSRPWYGPRAFVRTDPTPAKFRSMCERAKRHVDPELNLVISECWNEFGEGSFIEPTQEFGFGALDAIREVFARPGNWPPNVTPTEAEKAAFTWRPDEIPDDPQHSPSRQSGNLIANGGLEAGAEGWLTFDQAPAPIATDHPHSGARCLVIDPARQAKCAVPAPFLFGRDYEVSAWVRCSPNASVRVTSALFGPDGRWLKTYHDIGETSSQDWVEIKQTLPALDPGVGAIDVELVASGGVCQADDAAIRVVGQAAESAPIFTDAGTSPNAWLPYDSGEPQVAAGALFLPAGTGLKTKQLFPAGPDVVYALTARIKCDDRATLHITAAEFDEHGDWLKSYSGGGDFSWQDWIEVTCTLGFARESKAGQCDIEFVALGGKARVKDIRLVAARKLDGR